MTDRYGSYPPDEPVIGADYPPAPQLPSQQHADYIGAGSWGQGSAPAAPPPSYPEDDEYVDEYDDEYDEYYGDGYYDEESPARQPIFYAFIAIAILIGGGMIFLLFSLFGGGSDDPSVPAGFNVRIDSPQNNERVEIGKPKDVAVEATSNEQITKFELLVAGKSGDQVSVTEPGANGVYTATLKYTFDRTGEYELFVRVTSISGATKDSDKIKVVAIQPVGDKPVKIEGKIIGQASVRRGPGDNFDVIRTLNPGETVNILGKTRDGSWLLVDIEDGWVRKEAVDPTESLALVPIKDPTPTRAPATATPTEEPSPTVSPTANPNAPDFVPNNAILIDGGKTLRVTVINLSSNAYNGPLVVGVAKVAVTAPQTVVDAKIPANGSITVDFDLDPPITESGSSAQVSIDPGNVVNESNEDNNAATFVLTPAAEPPSIVIHAPSVGATSISVTVKNEGGELKSSEITVRLNLGDTSVEQTKTVALAKNQSESFTLARPAGSGQGVITVLVNGEPVASTNLDLG
ncbi:MAG TPA: CARDB domain-containing protein [Tepidiformaceae bacterium]|nr:CARDB domain-containing protein [Tepidiformaceae bacterium]